MGEWQAEADREAGSLPRKDPDVGLYPETLTLGPKLKGAA